ncbi:hypothetical protein DFH07DRAFT_770636 [Mycena maculata]|uniref:Uncharacterized protein n=1 Tax=Mycena maculata TaxID=230809 RepID=A0AAD7NK97_9AGAR|nr:hypothetical protein DFH07DRAFT_770636 [Mycena maculata]
MAIDPKADRRTLRRARSGWGVTLAGGGGMEQTRSKRKPAEGRDGDGEGNGERGWVQKTGDGDRRQGSRTVIIHPIEFPAAFKFLKEQHWWQSVEGGKRGLCDQLVYAKPTKEGACLKRAGGLWNERRTTISPLIAGLGLCGPDIYRIISFDSKTLYVFGHKLGLEPTRPIEGSRSSLQIWVLTAFNPQGELNIDWDGIYHYVSTFLSSPSDFGILKLHRDYCLGSCAIIHLRVLPKLRFQQVFRISEATRIPSLIQSSAFCRLLRSEALILGTPVSNVHVGHNRLKIQRLEELIRTAWAEQR